MTNRAKIAFLSSFTEIYKGSYSAKSAFELVLDIFSTRVPFEYATIFAYNYEKDEIFEYLTRRVKVELIESVKSFISLPINRGGEFPVVFNFGHPVPGRFEQNNLDIAIQIGDDLNNMIYSLINHNYLQHFYNITSSMLTRIQNNNLETRKYDEKLVEKLYDVLQSIIYKPLIFINDDYFKSVRIFSSLDKYWQKKVVDLVNCVIDIQDLLIDLRELGENRNVHSSIPKLS